MAGLPVARVASVLTAAVLVLTGTPVVANSQPSMRCLPQMAQLRQVHSQIQSHNAQPHVFQLPRQAAQLQTYNAEATQLQAAQSQAVAALDACRAEVEALARQQLTALEELADKRPGSMSHQTTAPPSQRAKLEAAIRDLRPNFKPRPPPPPGALWRVPPGTPQRAVYDILRTDNPGKSLPPTATLQGTPRPRIGDPDPRLPGRTIQPKRRNPAEPDVTGDHIVPLAQIVNMPGFMRLTPDNMWAVVRAPLNLQWMSMRTNSSKSSRIVAGMSGADPAWKASQEALRRRIEPKLQDLINRLLASQI
jgi:hypothetical protein